MIKFECTDGHPMSARVVDTKTGRDLSETLPISRVDIAVSATERVRATVQLETMRFDLASDKVSWQAKHPIGGGWAPLASMTFADGTVVEFHEGTVSVYPPTGDAAPRR